MKIRKITAGVLAVIIAASMTSVMASAATTSVGVSADKVTAVAGGEFEINVNLTEVPDTGIKAFDFAVGYDSSKVTITSVTEGAACKTGAAEQELASNSSLSGAMVSGSEYSCFDYSLTAGSINAMWATGLTDSQYWIDATGVMFTIKGTVNADVANGTVIDFTLGGIQRADSTNMIFGYNTDLGSVYYDSITTTNGSVTVLAGGETTTTETTTGGGTTTGGTVTGLRGDVNGDGRVTVADVILINKYMAGMVTLTPERLALADVVKDGKVNNIDGLKIMKLIGGLIASLD